MARQLHGAVYKMLSINHELFRANIIDYQLVDDYVVTHIHRKSISDGLTGILYDENKCWGGILYCVFLHQN